jgi:hypothetical protein
MTALDTLLVDGYTRGMNVPLTSQAGAVVRANTAGDNVDYITPQITTGTGSWNGESEIILVGGSGSRTFTMHNGAFLGQVVLVIDANGNAGSGNITVAVTEGLIFGSASLTGNGDSRRYVYVSAGRWNRSIG